MKSRFTLLIFGLIISNINSCATTANYAAILDTWVGHDVNELITTWGAPSSEYRMPNGNIMYIWLWNGGTLITSNYNYYLNLTLTNSVRYWCKTTFIVNKYGKIIGWNAQGNACKAY